MGSHMTKEEREKKDKRTKEVEAENSELTVDLALLELEEKANAESDRLHSEIAKHSKPEVEGR